MGPGIGYHEGAHNRCVGGLVSFLRERLHFSWLTIPSNSCNGPEVARYQYFVAAGNGALKMLKSVRHSGMRGPNKQLDILFQRSDPQPLGGTHGHPHAFVTSRKPEVALVGRRASKRVWGLDTDDWDMLARLGGSTPPIAFHWFDILLPVEKKLLRPNIEKPSFELSQFAEMPPPVPPQTPRPKSDDASPDSKKRAACPGTQPSSPATKRQKIDRG